MSLQPGNAPSRRNGPLWSKMAHGLERSILGRNAPHFDGAWSVRKISPRRPISSAQGVSRLSAHVESTCSTLVMSDQTLGIARGDGVHTCVHTYCGPGV